MKKAALLLLAFIAGQSLFAGEVLTGAAAKAKFPAALQGMDLHDAKYMQLTNGVEYFYGRFDSLAKNSHDPNGFKNDMHLIRVDYTNAPVRLKFWDSTTPKKTKLTTSAAASKCKALFGINGTFTNTSNTPQGFTKFQGTVIPNGNGCNDGLAMNDDKGFRYAQGWNETNSTNWSDVITSEAYGLHNGSIVYEGHFFSPANYPFSGATADGVIWIGVVDGRRSPISVGVSYWEVAEIQKALGCVEGMCHDGGGSTTMVISKELMTASDICGTQKESKSDSSYYTMNYLSDGSERAVINQLLFVEYDEPLPELVKVAKPTAKAGLVYDGSVQTGVASATGYTVANGSGTPAGDYTATVTLASGYCWDDGSTTSLSLGWSIARRPVTVTARNVTVRLGTALPESFGYDVTSGSLASGEALSGAPACAAADASSEGTWEIAQGTLTDANNPNYAIVFVSGRLTVSSLTLEIEPASAVYDGQPKAPAVIVKNGAGETVTGVEIVKPEGLVEAGVYEYAAKVEADGGVLTVTGEFEITKRKLTVTARPAAVVWGDDAPSFAYEIAGFVVGDTAAVVTGEPAFACDYAAGNDVGGYDVEVDVGGLVADNYSFEGVKGVLTVGKRTPQLSGVTATAIVYGQTLASSAVSAAVSPDVAGTFAWTDATLAPTVADSGVTAYAGVFTPKDAKNCEAVPFEATLTVCAREIAVPTAKTGLVCDFREQTGVEAGEGLALTGEKGVLPGEYVATATLSDKANTCWADDKTTDDKTIAWSIAAQSPTASGASEAGTDWNGSEVTVDVSGLDIGDYGADDLSASFEVNGKSYDGAVTGLGGNAYRLVFSVDATGDCAVLAEQAYEGTYRLTLGTDGAGDVEVASGTETLLQGVAAATTNDWFRETAATLGGTGGWTQDGEPAELPTDGGRIVVETADGGPFVFTPAKAMEENDRSVVETAFLYEGPGDEDDAPPAAAHAGVRIVEDLETDLVKLQVYAETDDGSMAWQDWNTADAEDYQFVVGTDYVLRFECDYETGSREVVCSVRAADETDFVPLFVGRLAPEAATAKRMSSVGISGVGKVSLLAGSFSRDYLDASVAEAGGARYGTVADAADAADGGVIRLLHKSSWRPTEDDLDRQLRLDGKDMLVVDLSGLGDGYELVWTEDAEIWALVVKGVEPAVEPVEPGTRAGPFGNAEAAANAAQKATLEPSAEVAAKLSTDAARERYMSMFGFAVTQDGDEWYVEAVLTEEAWSNLVESAQEATRQIAVGDLAALAAEGSAEVSVSDCIPGFYYTLYDGAAVGDLSADADERNRNVLCGADGGVVFPEVKKPSAAAGFFSIGAKESSGISQGERQE